MKKLVCLLTVLLVGCTAVEETKTERPVTFNMAIVNTNNINGKVENGVGYSRLATIIKNKEQRYGSGNVFYFDAGGNFSGSDFADKTRGESVVKVLNAMNLEATTLGKGDFIYGADRIKELEKISNFRIVASNVKYRNGENFVRPYILRNINGQKVAIIGIVSPALYDEMDEKTKTEIKIEEPILVIPKLLDQIKRNNIDFVIALTSMDDSNPNQEWNITEMVRDIPGIDIIVSSGETRGNTLERINDTYIVRENKDFESIGITRIDMFADDSQAGRMSYEKIKASDLTTLKVETKEKVEKIETEDVFYKVEKGNTLYSLAKQYGTTVDEIKRLNPSIEGNNIKVGETYKMLEKKQVEVKEEKVEELKVNKEEFDSIAVEMNDQESIPQETIEVGKVDVPVDPTIEKLINTLK